MQTSPIKPSPPKPVTIVAIVEGDQRVKIMDVAAGEGEAEYLLMKSGGLCERYPNTLYSIVLQDGRELSRFSSALIRKASTLFAQGPRAMFTYVEQCMATGLRWDEALEKAYAKWLRDHTLDGEPPETK